MHWTCTVCTSPYMLAHDTALQSMSKWWRRRWVTQVHLSQKRSRQTKQSPTVHLIIAAILIMASYFFFWLQKSSITTCNDVFDIKIRSVADYLHQHSARFMLQWDWFVCDVFSFFKDAIQPNKKIVFWHSQYILYFWLFDSKSKIFCSKIINRGWNFTDWLRISRLWRS